MKDQCIWDGVHMSVMFDYKGHKEHISSFLLFFPRRKWMKCLSATDSNILLQNTGSVLMVLLFFVKPLVSSLSFIPKINTKCSVFFLK